VTIGKTALAISAAVLLVPAGGWAETGFQFEVPDGWVDLSPTAPAANLKRVAPEFLAQITTAHVVFRAAPLDGAGNPKATMLGAVFPGTPDIQDVANSIVEQYAEELGTIPEAAIAAEKSEFVEIGNVTVVRRVVQLQAPGIWIKQMFYVMPGREATATATLAVYDEDSFEVHRSAFEAAAQRTTGLHDRQPRIRRIAKEVTSAVLPLLIAVVFLIRHL